MKIALSLDTIGLHDEVEQILAKGSNRQAALEKVVERVNSMAKVDSLCEDEIEAIRELFFNHLSLLSENEFDRSTVTKPLQNLLNPELGLLRSLKHSGESEEMTFKRKVEKVNLACQLGIKPDRNTGGATPSYLMRDIHNKVVGILKPKYHPELLSTFRKILFFLAQLFKVKSHGNLIVGDRKLRFMSEYGAYLIDRFFELSHVPITGIMDFRGEKGSLQIFEKGIEAKSFDFSKEPTEDELRLYQSFILMDYLICHTDRHRKNWLVAAQEGRIKQIYPIDNETSFVRYHPRQWEFHASVKLLEAAKKHPWARRPFLPDIQKRMSEFNQKSLSEFEAQVKDKFESNGLDASQFLTPEVLNAISLRTLVLSELSKKEGLTPHQLASYCYEEPINELLGCEFSHHLV